MIIIKQHISWKGNWSLRGKCWWFSGEAVEQWHRWPLDLSACCLLLDMKAERVDSGRAVETLCCKKQNKTKSPAVGGCKTKAKQQFRGPSNPKMSSGKMILALFPSDYQVRKKPCCVRKTKIISKVHYQIYISWKYLCLQFPGFVFSFLVAWETRISCLPCVFSSIHGEKAHKPTSIRIWTKNKMWR